MKWGGIFDGSYAQYVLLPNEQIYPIKSSLPLEVQAALPETWYTAYGAVRSVHLAAANTLCIRGLSSALGIAIAQLARALYPELHITGSIRASSAKRKAPALAYLVDSIIEDKQQQLQTSDCFDRIIDCVGPVSLQDSLLHCHHFGIVCSVGQLGGRWELEDFDPIMQLGGPKYLTSFYSGDVDASVLQDLFQLVESHGIYPQPAKIFHLEQLPETHAYIDSGDSQGKVVVIVQH